MFNQQIIIKVPREAVGGVYPAKAYRNGESVELASASHATYATAVANCITALSTSIYGDLSKNPIQIVAPSETRLPS